MIYSERRIKMSKITVEFSAKDLVNIIWGQMKHLQDRGFKIPYDVLADCFENGIDHYTERFHGYNSMGSEPTMEFAIERYNNKVFKEHPQKIKEGMIVEIYQPKNPFCSEGWKFVPVETSWNHEEDNSLWIAVPFEYAVIDPEDEEFITCFGPEGSGHGDICWRYRKEQN